jgi:hypothetical protein
MTTRENSAWFKKQIMSFTDHPKDVIPKAATAAGSPFDESRNREEHRLRHVIPSVVFGARNLSARP